MAMPRARGRRWQLARLGALVVSAACTQSAPEPASWRDLQVELARMETADRAQAIERFIAGRRGTPIIEDDTRLVFLVRHDAPDPPRVVGDFNAWAATPAGYDTSVGRTTRVDGTDWWYLEGSAEADARVEYVILNAIEARPDPLNDRQVQAHAGRQSEVRMPRWVPQPELDTREAVPAGELLAERFHASALGGNRRVWYYLPARYADSTDRRYPTVYVLDGGSYVERMDMPRVLDRLMAGGSVPEAIVVFVEPDDRQDEYVTSDAWTAFVATELVPAVDRRFRTIRSPDRRVVLGSSLGAHGAARAALTHPAVFALCAAIAPPAGAAPLVRDGGAAAARVRWFVMGGRYDVLLPDARRLREALAHAGAETTYVEVPEGHSTETFRGHLDDALAALLR